MVLELSPIVLFVYNRPWHTLQTLEALKSNDLADRSILYIYCDGPKTGSTPEELKKINEVREIVKNEKWCGEVIVKEQNKNLGLAESIIRGVTEVINKFGKIIVLEDDIVTSKFFLHYMNQSLLYYEKEESVMHISGYFPPVKEQLPNFFFYNQTSCWGWGTWKTSWEYLIKDSQTLYDKIIASHRLKEFNLDNSYPFFSQLEANLKGTLKTWAIKWHSSVFLNRGLCLHPNKSYVLNIGFDGSGENCSSSNVYLVNELNIKKFEAPYEIKENKKARRAVIRFNKSHDIIENKSLRKKIKIFFKLWK